MFLSIKLATLEAATTKVWYNMGPFYLFIAAPFLPADNRAQSLGE